MLLLHVSDTHLGASRPGRLRDREMDFYEVFDEVVDVAIRERVDAVIHAGDLFDSYRPSPQTYYYAYRSLRRLREAGIPVLAIAGQHDQPKASALPPLRVLEEVGVLRVLAIDRPRTTVVSLRSGELGVAALPYVPPQVAGEIVRELRRPDAGRRVLVAHLLLKELGIPNAHLSLAELRASDYDYVALGDYHMRYERICGSTPAVYPGSTEALDVLESSDERYVALVDLSKREASVGWVKLARFRRWVVAEGVRSYSDLVKAIGSAKLEGFQKPPIVYVELASRSVPQVELRRISDYLDSLVRSGRALLYRVHVPSIAGGPAEVVAESRPSTQVPTLEQVVYRVVGDPDLAKLVLSIVEGSEDQEFVRSVVGKLLEDESLLAKLRSLVRGRAR